jgi:hypothetical protein
MGSIDEKARRGKSHATVPLRPVQEKNSLVPSPVHVPINHFSRSRTYMNNSTSNLIIINQQNLHKLSEQFLINFVTL